VAYSIVRLLRLASIVICLIVIASFAIFAVGQTKNASEHQQQVIAESGSSAGSTQRSTSHESGLHKAIDEASNTFTSPFAGLFTGTSSQWAIRGGKLVLALLLYGFVAGFIARAIRVRV
jgi:hypothetical protein